MIRRLILTAATLAALAGCTTADCPPPDPFDADTFPCAEDEVLGYSPDFEPGRVGCIHIEELTP